MAETRSLFQWTEAYSVDDPEIDRQHKKLFGYADDLHRAMLSGTGKQILERLLANLVAYTREHFSHEEQLMARIGYPDRDAHVREHVELTRQVTEFQQRFACGQVAMTVEISQFLSQWLKHHISTVDRRLCAQQ